MSVNTQLYFFRTHVCMIQYCAYILELWFSRSLFPSYRQCCEGSSSGTGTVELVKVWNGLELKQWNRQRSETGLEPVSELELSKLKRWFHNWNFGTSASLLIGIP